VSGKAEWLLAIGEDKNKLLGVIFSFKLIRAGTSWPIKTNLSTSTTRNLEIKIKKPVNFGKNY